MVVAASAHRIPEPSAEQADRRLLLFRARLDLTAWYRQGRPPAARVASTGLHWRWGAPTASTVRDYRLPDGCEGHRELRARQHGRAVYRLCLGPSAWIGWIGGVVTVPADALLVYGAWSDPAWRGSALHGTAVARACAHARFRGARVLIGGIETQEFAASARLYASLGLGLLEPQAILCWRAGQLRERAPEPDLIEVAERLHRRYATRVLGE